MEKNMFNARGQIVYIEPKWITGETCLFYIQNSSEYLYAKSKLSKVRREFVSKLEKEGFIITTDKKDLDNGAVCFIMNDTAVCDYGTDIDDYKRKFDKRMFEAGGEKLNYPHSVNMKEYFEEPFLPAVLKNENMNGGIDKFFIETLEQVEVIKKFYDFYSGDDAYDEAFSNSIFQQYIETPTKHKTYMRVLMAASGDVMGASLKYSTIDERKRTPKGIFERHFWDEKSEYFLNCKGMFNYYSGGENISIPQPKYSYDKKKILEAHGIDPENAVVPSDVLEVASSIMEKCNQELGIMCGFDFLLNEADNKWYYLENQAFPAIEEWAVTKGIRRIKVNSIDDYIKYCGLELEARHEALCMYTEKKLAREDTENKQKVITKI